MQLLKSLLFVLFTGTLGILVVVDNPIFSCPQDHPDPWCGLSLGGDGETYSMDPASIVSPKPKPGPLGTIIKKFQCDGSPQSIWCCPSHSLTFHVSLGTAQKKVLVFSLVGIVALISSSITPGTDQVPHSQIQSACQSIKGS
ncbi:hypothetical protein MJO28_016394 [Puccinia striiformis f. sp. tritici]|uniref:Uncharacterized protein n=1 Tax=Puccinia striiformis f. sp. tritici TaxID=168172 RepID=A0ACC0DMY7_9BASI|nr:hypothetical protein MJO28_016394 [Puccinia striiformis f. sp. tritici]